jgi:hypothetical protein
MSARYKPGSRCQSVWEVYEASGAEAAIEKGRALGLSESTLKNWIRHGVWTVADGKQRKEEKAAKPPSIVETKLRNLEDKIVQIEEGRKKYRGPRVHLRSDPRCKGVLIDRGHDQQWEIKWDNGNVLNMSGRTQFEIAEWIVIEE